jgi:2-phospho-L-lactate transferase/gluconeogenesis factor (CofD/UPF0052 family)
MNVTIFNGGRGARSLIRSLLKIKNIKVNSIVNAYDDGKSTGEVREFFNMLGPSDIRKTQITFLDKTDPNYILYKDFFNFRLSKNISHEKGLSTINNFFEIYNKFFPFDVYLKNKIKLFLNIFIKELNKNELNLNKKFQFDDCSIINCIYAGAYIFFDKNFLMSIYEINKMFNIKHNVIPNSLTNLKLVAIRENGEILYSESDIVSLRSNKRIKQIFLIDYYYNFSFSPINQLSISEKINYLKKIQKDAIICSKTKSIINKSDLLIFSPGTQHSSLLPTYLTKNLSSIIISNKDVYKVLIINIGADYENPVYIASEYIKNATKYLNLSSNSNYPPKYFFDLTLINKVNKKGKLKNNYVKSDSIKVNELGINFIEDNFEDKNNLGYHDGDKVINVILENFGA